MGHFTVEDLKCELHKIQQSPLTPRNLEMFVYLHKAVKCLEHDGHGFTEQDAMEWVKCMTPPARWTVEQTTAVMKQRGYCHKPYEFCAVMNALASDYGKTMAKHGADKPEIWADLAHDFIEDADAEGDKVGRYYREIVRH